MKLKYNIKKEKDNFVIVKESLELEYWINFFWVCFG